MYVYDPALNTCVKLFDFFGSGIGDFPGANLVDSGARLYGVTSHGGQTGDGALFEYIPATNTKTRLFSFYTSGGRRPQGSFILKNAKIYGTTAFGGAYSKGTLYEYDLQTTDYTVMQDFDVNGHLPNNTLVSFPALMAPGIPNDCMTLPSVTINSTNNNTWVPIVDTAGKVVAEIKANGNNLGVVTAGIYTHTGAVRQDGSGAHYANRNIAITPTTQPTTNVDIRLYIRTADYTTLQASQSGINSINDVDVYKTTLPCNGTFQVLPALKVSGATAAVWDGGGYIFSAAIPSFSTFYFGVPASGPLPVSLLSFTGTAKARQHLLEWKTADETAIKAYELELSNDGSNYRTLARIPALGNASNRYDYTNEHPQTGNNYYRLKVLEENGEFRYSNSVLLRYTEAAALQVYPNPAQDKLYIVTNNAGEHPYTIVSSTGQTVKTGVLATSAELDISDLPQGNYLLTCNDANIWFVKTK